MEEQKIFYDSTDNIKLCGLLSKVNDSDKIVVLCHGFSGNKSEKKSFDVLVERMRENNINSFRFDFRSHGESSGNDWEMTVSGEIEDLKTSIKLLENLGYNEFILLGASFGAGIVSLLDFENYSNINSLILWYGAFDFKDPRNQTFSDDKWEIAKSYGYYELLKKTGVIRKIGLNLFNEVNKFKPYENLSKLELPLLFVHGTIDTSVPPELSIETASKCKNARVELIEGGWHTFDNSKEALDNAIEISVDYIKNNLIFKGR